MSREERFQKLASKVADPQAKVLFERIGRKALPSWNDHSFDMMSILSSISLPDILKDRYVAMSFISAPLSWLFFIDEPEMQTICASSIDKIEASRSDDKEIMKLIISRMK